jgi:hypothetical protein
VVEQRTWKIRGRLIETDLVVTLGSMIIATVRDPEGQRVEQAQFGPLTVHVGDFTLSTEGTRDEIEKRFGYSADPSQMDSPEGQDNGVWVWQPPQEAQGRVSIEADWLPRLEGGTVEIIIA